QRAFALQLDRDARPGLEAAREQHRRRDAFAEQALEVRRVVVLRDDLLPGFLEPHERAAYAAALEQKALHFVHVECPLPNLRPVLRRRAQSLASSRARSTSLTCCGFALPRDAFMTCPTRKPSTCVLPPRYCSTWSGNASTTVSTSASIAARSVICVSPRLSMIPATVPPSFQSASKTSFAILPEIVPSSIRSRSAAS